MIWTTLIDLSQMAITNVIYNQVLNQKLNLGVSNYANITSDMPLTYHVLLIDYKIVIPSYTIFEPQRVE